MKAYLIIYLLCFQSIRSCYSFRIGFHRFFHLFSRSTIINRNDHNNQRIYVTKRRWEPKNTTEINPKSISSTRSSRSHLGNGRSRVNEQQHPPHLELNLLKNVIREWQRELPSVYIQRPLVIVGPSGVGKGRLINTILRDYSRFFCKVITHTTRSIRKDETNGTSYHFISNETFHQLLHHSSSQLLTSSTSTREHGFFMEHGIVHGNSYGISHDAWMKVIQSNRIPIFEIDIQGAKYLHSIASNYNITPWYLFIAPPNLEALKQRLIKRNTETSEQLKLRLKNACWEMKEVLKCSFFNEILINENITKTSQIVYRAVRDRYPGLPSAGRLRLIQRRLYGIRRWIASSYHLNANFSFFYQNKIMNQTYSPQFLTDIRGNALWNQREVTSRYNVTRIIEEFSRLSDHPTRLQVEEMKSTSQLLLLLSLLNLMELYLNILSYDRRTISCHEILHEANIENDSFTLEADDQMKETLKQCFL